jgi:hypothetical protein
MIDRHLRAAFLDLIDERGVPHPGHAGATCSSCDSARTLSARFEHEFDEVMRSMAPHPMPPQTLPMASRRQVARRATAWLTAAVAVLTVAGVAVALANPSSTASPDVTASDATEPSALESAAPQTEFDRWRAELPEVLDATTPFQAAIIGDGVVTQTEHDRAQRAYLECVRDADIVVGPSRDEFGLLTGLTLKGADPNVDVDAVNTHCEREFYADVWPGWYAVVVGEDTEEARLRRLGACFAERDDPSSVFPATLDEIRARIARDMGTADLRECLEETRHPPTR